MTLGNMKAIEMAEAASDGTISLEAALKYHLEVNHFPPIGEVLPTALEIVQEVRAGGSVDDWVDLPEGVEHKRYGKACPAHECIRAWHLEAFLEEE